MNSSAAVEPAPPKACSACGGALDALGRCQQCGAVFGEAYRCPLCHAVSDIEPSAALHYRCRTCGGPRIPPSAGASSAGEVALLQQARASQLRAGAYRAGSGFALASGLLSLVVTNVVLLATSPAPFARFFALFASVVPLGLAFLAFRRAARYRRDFQRALEGAWLSAAGRLVTNAGGALDAATLAKSLRIDETRAELLLAEHSVQDLSGPIAPAVPKVRVTELADESELLDGAEREADAHRTKP